MTNFEMETAGIYGLARLLGHQALSVNAIIANRVHGTFSSDPQQTIDRLISTVLQKMLA
jgi:uridine phosphorylase